MIACGDPFPLFIIPQSVSAPRTVQANTCPFWFQTLCQAHAESSIYNFIPRSLESVFSPSSLQHSQCPLVSSLLIQSFSILLLILIPIPLQFQLFISVSHSFRTSTSINFITKCSKLCFSSKLCFEEKTEYLAFIVLKSCKFCFVH